MYINRKDGTLVEAEKYYSIGLKRDGWIVKTDNNTLYIPVKDFQWQYGEAMICPLRKDCPIECIRKQPHPKSSLCSVPGCYGTSCVSYIPEEHKEYDIDNEPVFPNCGTCNARKNLDDKRIEQINSTDKIEIFIDGKKTVFVREGKKEEEITSLLRKIVGQNGWIYQEDFTNIKKLFSEMESK